MAKCESSHFVVRRFALILGRAAQPPPPPSKPTDSRFVNLPHSRGRTLIIQEKNQLQHGT
ncbi:hypothetical protein Pyn_03243 [Prunus yedoensis var. nudiflora]|uniref:Uncharacterized protein n=1 Tax=Prunus yedoensis var. nudiflora TaxID=2094558 RepID=A0A314ZIU7_PRUYE|nr:hypothetical protein Pyn_03243 [Prunus yedoensis var. nudiflora]